MASSTLDNPFAAAVPSPFPSLAAQYRGFVSTSTTKSDLSSATSSSRAAMIYSDDAPSRLSSAATATSPRIALSSKSSSKSSKNPISVRTAPCPASKRSAPTTRSISVRHARRARQSRLETLIEILTQRFRETSSRRRVAHPCRARSRLRSSPSSGLAAASLARRA